MNVKPDILYQRRYWYLHFQFTARQVRRKKRRNNKKLRIRFMLLLCLKFSGWNVKRMISLAALSIFLSFLNLILLLHTTCVLLFTNIICFGGFSTHFTTILLSNFNVPKCTCKKKVLWKLNRTTRMRVE